MRKALVERVTGRRARGRHRFIRHDKVKDNLERKGL